MTALHQVVPSVQPGQPLTIHAFHVRDALRGAGVESEIFVEARPPEFVPETISVHEYVEHTRRVWPGPVALLYQMHGAATSAETFFALPERKVVHYHSVTPAHWFAGWDDLEMLRSQVHATQVRRLGRRVHLALADTQWEAAELEAQGYEAPTVVVPMLVSPADLAAPPDRRLVAALGRRDGPLWCSPGRLSPHAGHHDAVRALALHRARTGDGSRLVVVGEAASPAYARALAELVSRLGLEDAVRVVADPTPAQRSACLASSDVVTCLSEHEGFALRLLEALARDVPVVAYDAAGIPDTVGGAAVLLSERSILAVALAADRAARDTALRARLAAAGRHRLEELAPHRTRARLVEALLAVVEEAA